MRGFRVTPGGAKAARSRNLALIRGLVKESWIVLINIEFFGGTFCTRYYDRENKQFFLVGLTGINGARLNPKL